MWLLDAFWSLSLILKDLYLTVRDNFKNVVYHPSFIFIASITEQSNLKEEEPDAFFVDDYFLIIFASQLLIISFTGLLMANKNLFLFLLNLELLYLSGGFLFAVFSVYWFYDVRGIIYAFMVVVLAGAESVVGLALLIVLHRRGVNLRFFNFKNTINKLVPITLAVIPVKNQYANFLIFFAFIFVLFILILYLLNKVVARSSSVQKTTSYECGFEPFGDARLSFQVQFYTVALIFLLFDLEMMFLIPWALSLSVIGFFGRITMLLFFVILGIGFYYEWNKKAIDFMKLKK